MLSSKEETKKSLLDRKGKDNGCHDVTRPIIIQRSNWQQYRREGLTGRLSFALCIEICAAPDPTTKKKSCKMGDVILKERKEGGEGSLRFSCSH